MVQHMETPKSFSIELSLWALDTAILINLLQVVYGLFCLPSRINILGYLFFDNMIFSEINKLSWCISAITVGAGYVICAAGIHMLAMLTVLRYKQQACSSTLFAAIRVTLRIILVAFMVGYLLLFGLSSKISAEFIGATILIVNSIVQYCFIYGRLHLII